MNSNSNNKINLIWEIVKWEFRRWFKIKEQIITLLIGALLSLLIFGGQSLLQPDSDKELKIAVINISDIQLQFNTESKITYYKTELIKIDSQKNLLADDKIDGILIVRDIESAELIVNKVPSWLEQVKEELNWALQRVKLAQSNITSRQLEYIFKQTDLKLNFTGIKKEQSSTSEKVTAGIFIGLMLIGVFFGLAYQFVAITGEKQLRITEVIVSAISPQTWIDGKILGISLLSLALLFTYCLTTLIFVFTSSLFGSGWHIPLSITKPMLVLTLFVFSLAGFFFWNTFFSAIAATINDPNTSARGSLIMAPVIPVAIAFFALGNPDSIVMQILSLFPLTSASVLSARLVLSDVSIIEILLSLFLLISSTWYLRKAAGKIFSFSILMYGKEASWKEISRWLKESLKQ